MPFDGGEFPRSPESLLLEPLSSGAAPADPRAWRVWARLRALLPASPGGRECPPFDSAVCLLRAARALIEAEGDWTRGAYRTSDGKHCTVGALRKAAQGQYGRRVRHEAHGLLLGVARKRGFGSVERMNDSSTHAEVLAAFDAAIAAG